MSWEEAHVEEALRCAICTEGQGIYQTDEGRLICPRCLSKSKAPDVVRLRRERRTQRKD